LANAIKLHQLSLVYQPIWDVETNKVVKLEALVRWQHPERGAISPVEFIPLAEESGLIQGLGQWILLHACADLVRLRRQGFTDIQMSINRSTPEFQTIDLDAREWLTTIADMGLDPASIIFEITESLLMSNQDQNRQRMHALRAAGCRIAIDDFGTGYSALSYLRSFPIDVVKIDRAFVRSIPEEKQECLLLDGMINLVKSLGMTLIIEGVETNDQLAYLKQRQCSYIQGFLFSKPLPFNELICYLRQVATVTT
jgi:EAL domain-containing protein (putative c-di-GMP-specific phosphodiesterase class I)